VAGILTFQCRAGLISTRVLLVGLALAGAVSCAANGVVAAGAGVGTALVIRFVDLPNSRLTGFGLISYSLYLLHVPVGGKIMNLGGRFVHGAPALMVLLAAAMGASIGAAAIFYRLVELPSQRLSTSIRFRANSR